MKESFSHWLHHELHLQSDIFRILPTDSLPKASNLLLSLRIIIVIELRPRALTSRDRYIFVRREIYLEPRGNTTQYFIGDATHIDVSSARGAGCPETQTTGDRGGHPWKIQLEHIVNTISWNLSFLFRIIALKTSLFLDNFGEQSHSNHSGGSNL